MAKGGVYVENKIITRTANLNIDWIKNLSSRNKYIVIDGDYSFDFYHDVDRSKWLDYFETQKEKTNFRNPDHLYLTTELVAGKYKERANQHDPSNPYYVPMSLEQSPETFLYNDLLGYNKIHIRHILPALRKRGYFNPITPLAEKMFFDFDMSSFKIETFKIPHNYKLRTIFKVSFKMIFHADKYVEYLFTKKNPKFFLNMWPDFRFEMKFFQRFPSIISKETNRMYDWFDEHILSLIGYNKKILQVIYNATKVKLQKVKRINMKMDRNTQAIIMTTPDILEFTWQLFKAKIGLDGGRYSNDFDVQAISPEFAKNKIMTQQHGSPLMALLYFIAFYNIYKGFFGKNISMTRYVSEVMRHLKMGKAHTILRSNK